MGGCGSTVRNTDASPPLEAANAMLDINLFREGKKRTARTTWKDCGTETVADKGDATQRKEAIQKPSESPKGEGSNLWKQWIKSLHLIDNGETKGSSWTK